MKVFETRVEMGVHHLEKDVLIPGNIIYGNRNSLRTTNGADMSIVAGAEDIGYLNGNLSSSKFNNIYGFLQLSNGSILVADHYNDCIRHVDRVAETVSDFVGSCTSSGFTDGFGTAAQFSDPQSIIADRRDQTYALISDRFNSAIRRANLQTAEVTTILAGNGIPVLKSISFGETDDELLLLSDGDGAKLQKLSLTDLTLTTLYQSLYSNDADGPLNIATMKTMNNIAHIAPSVYAVADTSSWKIRILDFANDRVTSICTGLAYNEDGTIDKCGILSPQSLFYSGDKIYVGASGRLRMISGNLEVIHYNIKSHIGNISKY